MMGNRLVEIDWNGQVYEGTPRGHVVPDELWVRYQLTYAQLEHLLADIKGQPYAFSHDELNRRQAAGQDTTDLVCFEASYGPCTP